jgi:hypothetical protein
MTSAVDPNTCPACGETNACGMLQGQSECWCFQLKIPAEALERVPRDAKNVACICARCAASQRAAQEL